MPTDVKSLYCRENKHIVVTASNCRRKNGTWKMTEITTTKLFSSSKIFAYILDWRWHVKSGKYIKLMFPHFNMWINGG